jgi:hypothetical protein
MATEKLEAPVSAFPRTRGRRLVWLGWGLLLLGLVIYAVQFFALKQYVVPWYAPVLGTAGAAAALLAVCQRWTVLRIVGLLVCALLVGVEWYFLLFMSRAPAYAGLEPGQSIPAFTAIRADGTHFSNEQLAGQPTVLLFFRGHW